MNDDNEVGSRGGVSRGYARYVLFVLVLVYVLNFVDRQILSILAEDIKADLGLTDANLGFLYGTVFAVFYAVFGIPLSRIADIWIRKNIIALGLFFWSLMTVLSGTARSFTSLSVYRIGVGIGESSASPAAFSLLGDYFSPRQRATVLAIYSSGVYIGAGLGTLIGGAVVDRWNGAYAAGGAPFGMAGWQAAYITVGLPGILLALLVWTLREPARGSTEGIALVPDQPRILRELGIELAAVTPVLSLVTLYRVGAGATGLLKNAGIAAGLALVVISLSSLIGSAVQWIALGVGMYAFLSWVQILAKRDAPAHGMIFRSRAIVFGMVGFGWHVFMSYSWNFWVAPYLLRTHDVSTASVGLVVGVSLAIAGFAGATFGGYLSDWLKQKTGRARLYVGMFSAMSSIPPTIATLTTSSLEWAYVFFFVAQFLSSMWIGSAIALSNELVLPRMRATAGVFYILVVTFLGLALGPYTVGHLSDYFLNTMTSSASLRTAMLIALGAEGIACVFFWISSRYVEDEESRRADRAQSYGEPVANYATMSTQ